MRRSARLAVVPLAAALLLTGCGRPGTAATVDGERITDAQVATLVDELSRLTSSTSTPGTILPQMIVTPTVLRLAAEAGVATTDQEAIAVLDEGAAQKQVEPWDYSDELVDHVRQLLAAQVLMNDTEAGTALREEVAALDVEVNPRFGTWRDDALAPPAWPWLIVGGGESDGSGVPGTLAP